MSAGVGGGWSSGREGIGEGEGIGRRRAGEEVVVKVGDRGRVFEVCPGRGRGTSATTSENRSAFAVR